MRVVVVVVVMAMSEAGNAMLSTQYFAQAEMKWQWVSQSGGLNCEC